MYSLCARISSTVIYKNGAAGNREKSRGSWRELLASSRFDLLEAKKNMRYGSSVLVA